MLAHWNENWKTFNAYKFPKKGLEVYKKSSLKVIRRACLQEVSFLWFY